MSVPFQSSPGLWAGCNQCDGSTHFYRTGVSILTRPLGRMQLGWVQAILRWEQVSILTRPLGRMQLLDPSGVAVRGQVSILTRPLGRMQPVGGGPLGVFCAVSILTRPLGRMQQPCQCHGQHHYRVSILTRPLGRMQLRGDDIVRIVDQVSILTRPLGRMQRRRHGHRPGGIGRFNPHPAFGPDATSAVTGIPTFRSGFNPHPAFGPDATGLATRQRKPTIVSIFTRPLGRMQRRSDAIRGRGYVVSILTRPLGRMQPVTDIYEPDARTGFNPHPAFGPDATCRFHT